MYKKYKRYNFCEQLEKDIQLRASTKDKKFSLSGDWKKFVRKQSVLHIYAVDGEWIRNNLSILFGHGGHGYVHEFIPIDEIWIDTDHHRSSRYDCGCTKIYKGGKISKYFFDEVAKHEIIEFEAMSVGKPFWLAHKIALKKEKEE